MINNPTTATTRFSAKVLFAICLAHFTGDFYQSFITPLLPVIKARFELSLPQIGIIASVVTLSGFVSQPLIGFLADRFEPRRFLLGGLLLSSIFIPLLGVTPWFGLLVILAFFGALGSAMYHPTAAGMVGEFAGQRTAFGMSIFGLGGTMAFALGPVAVTSFVVFFGLSRLPLVSVFGLAAFVFLLFTLPAPARQAVHQGGFFRQLRSRLGPMWKPVLLLWLIGSIRSLADVGIRTFYPILWVDKGHSLVSAGAILSLFTLGGALSAIICGQLADKKGYKPIFYASYALSPPALLWFVYAGEWTIYPASLVAGFVLLATTFLGVALAARLVPESRSLVSSLTLGFAVGMGGLASPLVGKLAEIYGIQPVMTAAAVIPLFCLVLVPFIPESRAEMNE